MEFARFHLCKESPEVAISNQKASAIHGEPKHHLPTCIPVHFSNLFLTAVFANKILSDPTYPLHSGLSKYRPRDPPFAPRPIFVEAPLFHILHTTCQTVTVFQPNFWVTYRKRSNHSWRSFFYLQFYRVTTIILFLFFTTVLHLNGTLKYVCVYLRMSIIQPLLIAATCRPYKIQKSSEHGLITYHWLSIYDHRLP